MPAGRGEQGGQLLPLRGERSGLHADTGARRAKHTAAGQESAPLPGQWVQLSGVTVSSLAIGKLCTSPGEREEGPAPGLRSHPGAELGSPRGSPGPAPEAAPTAMASAPRTALATTSVCWSWRAVRWRWQPRSSVSLLQTPGAVSRASSCRCRPRVPGWAGGPGCVTPVPALATSDDATLRESWFPVSDL